MFPNTAHEPHPCWRRRPCAGGRHGDDLDPGADWQHYVRGPAQSVVRPVAVLSSFGDVTGEEALLTRTGSVVLTMEHGGSEPSVVMDYGQNVAGVPWIEVASSTGKPTLLVSYSESATWTDADGDFEGSHNDTGSHDRVETFHVHERATVSSGLIQGGQRYQRIALSSPGTLVISDVGLHYTSPRATAADYRGWFACSSDLLNRVWYDGAYTVQLNQLPACTLPVAWTVSDGSLVARGGNLAVLTSGTGWSDCTVTFQTQVVERAAGWIVRASEEGGTDTSSSCAPPRDRGTQHASSSSTSTTATRNVHRTMCGATPRWGEFPSTSASTAPGTTSAPQWPVTSSP